MVCETLALSLSFATLQNRTSFTFSMNTEISLVLFLFSLFFIDKMADRNAQIRASLNAKLIESGEREQ